MFPKNDLELEIFNRKGPNFFSRKMCFRPYRHIERKKSRKKILSRKVVGTPWIYPIKILNVLHHTKDPAAHCRLQGPNQIQIITTSP